MVSSPYGLILGFSFKALLVTSLLGVIFFPPTAIADIVARCDEPKGWRASYGDLHDLLGKPIISSAQGVLWVRDGISNMNPIVVWRVANPNVLRIGWGSMIPAELVGKVESDQRFYDATIIHQDEQVVQALLKRCGPRACTVSLYSFFIRLDFLTVAQSWPNNGFVPGNDNLGETWLFAAKCRRMN